MGHGSYSAADWNRLKQSRGISAQSTADDIFRGNGLNEKYLPKFIHVRESRDSADSPNATPIIIGFDSTGSMGYLAAEIAKNSLNKTATMILDKRPVPDPHIMCAAFTSPGYSALQVTQFEADIRVVEQLLDFSLGGGNRFSYDSLVWYFAWKHTSADCFEKHGKKGFLFCVGDEISDDGRHEILSAAEIAAVFGDKNESGWKTRELYEAVSERYEVFHIITGSRVGSALETWEKLIPGRNAVIDSGNIEYLAEVMISLIQLAGGASVHDAVSQWTGGAREAVQAAVSTIRL